MECKLSIANYKGYFQDSHKFKLFGNLMGDFMEGAIKDLEYE